MGGDPALGAALRRWKQTRGCYWNNLDPKKARRLPGPACSVIDILVLLNDLRGRKFKGDHLYNIIMKPIKDKFNRGFIERCAITFDRQVIVPLRKSEEHIRRASSSPNNKKALTEYSSESWITDSGIWDPVVKNTSETGDLPLICIDSILRARSIRYIIMWYLHQRIMRDPTMRPFEMILDYAEVPYFLCNGISYPMHDWQSPFSEGEMMNIKWARAHMDKFDVIVDTSDTDIIGQAFKFIESCNPKKEVWWRIGRERKTKNRIYDDPCDEHCDLKQMYAAMKNMKITAKTYTLAFIICGIDYNDAKNALRCGADWIFHHIIHSESARELADAIQPATEWLAKETDICWKKPTGLIDFAKVRELSGLSIERFKTALDLLLASIRSGATSRRGREVGHDIDKARNDINWAWAYFCNIDWINEPGSKVCPELHLMRNGTTEMPPRPNWEEFKKTYAHSQFKLTPRSRSSPDVTKESKSIITLDDDDNDDVVVVAAATTKAPPKRESKEPIAQSLPSPPPAVPKRKRIDYEHERQLILDAEEPIVKRARAMFGLFAPSLLKDVIV